jgi:hypothetical protein
MLRVQYEGSTLFREEKNVMRSKFMAGYVGAQAHVFSSISHRRYPRRKDFAQLHVQFLFSFV